MAKPKNFVLKLLVT